MGEGREEYEQHWHDDELIGTVPVTARTISALVFSHLACLALGALLVALFVGSQPC